MMKKIFAVLIAALVCISMLIPCYAQEIYLSDDANILTSEQEQELTEKLSEYSDSLSCQMVVVTVDTLSGQDAQDYADTYYSTHNIGDGFNAGIVFVFSEYEASWGVSQNGLSTILDDEKITEIVSSIGDYVRNGQYYDAFCVYADTMNAKLSQSANQIGGVKNRNPIIWLFIDLAIGFVIAFIIMKAKTANLKSVKAQANANSYVVPNSFVVTGQSDAFLYTNVVKTPIPKNNTSGGSNGNSNGGASGHF